MARGVLTGLIFGLLVAALVLGIAALQIGARQAIAPPSLVPPEIEERWDGPLALAPAQPDGLEVLPGGVVGLDLARGASPPPVLPARVSARPTPLAPPPPSDGGAPVLRVLTEFAGPSVATDPDRAAPDPASLLRLPDRIAARDAVGSATLTPSEEATVPPPVAPAPRTPAPPGQIAWVPEVETRAPSSQHPNVRPADAAEALPAPVRRVALPGPDPTRDVSVQTGTLPAAEAVTPVLPSETVAPVTSAGTIQVPVPSASPTVTAALSKPAPPDSGPATPESVAMVTARAAVPYAPEPVALIGPRRQVAPLDTAAAGDGPALAIVLVPSGDTPGPPPGWAGGVAVGLDQLPLAQGEAVEIPAVPIVTSQVGRGGLSALAVWMRRHGAAPVLLRGTLPEETRTRLAAMGETADLAFLAAPQDVSAAPPGTWAAYPGSLERAARHARRDGAAVVVLPDTDETRAAVARWLANGVGPDVQIVSVPQALGRLRR